MSPRLTNVSSKRAHRALKRLGFLDAHREGSHQAMVRPREDGKVDVVVLVMSKSEINPFTLRGILDKGGVTVQEFMDAL